MCVTFVRDVKTKNNVIRLYYQSLNPKTLILSVQLEESACTKARDASNETEPVCSSCKHAFAVRVNEKSNNRKKRRLIIVR